MSKKKVNVAMIGYAFMGRAHSNAWRQVTRFMDPAYEPVLKVICGRNEERVKAAADTLGWAEWATDWRAVVERDDIDIVDVGTPGDSHAPISIAAARAGKAILCEKPLANTVAEAETMVKAVKDAGVINMVCHNYRRAPAVALARQIIEEGKLGRLFHYRGTYLQDWLASPEMTYTWRMSKKQAGSGALGDLVSHTLDLAQFLVGDITQVCGLTETFVKERLVAGTTEKRPVEVDDTASALIRFDNGAVGSLEGSRCAAGRRNYNRFEINGSNGSIAFNLERMNELELYIEEGPQSGFRTILATEPQHPYVGRWWPPGHLLGYEHTFIHAFVDFLNAMASGTSPKPDFEDGLKNQRVMDAIERSAASRGWVSV